MRSWRDGRTITKLYFPSTYGIQNAIEDQTKIGWNNFSLGRWSIKWQLVQQKYIKQINSKRSSLRWITSIINKFMNVVWDIWNFRNFLIHGKRGINDRARHKELNFQIRQQFTIGFENLLLSNYRNFRRYSLPLLLDSSRETKQNWIKISTQRGQQQIMTTKSKKNEFHNMFRLQSMTSLKICMLLSKLSFFRSVRMA